MTQDNGKPSRVRRFDPTRGLHQQGRVFQLSYTAEQCEDLLKCLEVMVQKTIDCAPRRASGYALTRPNLARHEREEHRLERAICQAWRPDGRLYGTDFSTSCNTIPFFQVRIQAPRRRELNAGWGRVDLVGVSKVDNFPVPIELKKGEANDTLLRVVVEIAAYALAMRAGWSGLRNDWTTAIQGLAPAGGVPDEWKRCQLVCAAPQSFWDRKLGFNGERDRMPRNAWEPFVRVLNAFKGYGLTFEFVSVEVDRNHDAELPIIVSAKPVPLLEFASYLSSPSH